MQDEGLAVTDDRASEVHWFDGAAAGFVLFPCFIVIFATAGFALGLPARPWVLVPAFPATLAGIFLAAGRSRTTGQILAAVIPIHVAAYLLCGLTFDGSYDGLWYHQEAVLRLANGWNPLYEDPALYGSRDPRGGLLAGLAYAKAGWIMAAPFFELGQRIESAKLFTLTLSCGVGCYAYATLRRLVPLARSQATLFALLIALNPVAIYQSTSFYVDGLLGCCMTLAMIGLFRHVATGQGRELLVVAPAVMLLINLKYTGVLYALFLLFVAALAIWWRRSFQAAARFGAGSAGLLTVSMFIIGFAPYGINVRDHGGPFYPVVMSSGVNPRIVSNNLPPNIAERNRFSRFVLVNFAYSDGVYPPPATSPKFPFWIGAREAEAWAYHDVRIGGLGPLFGALLVATAGLFVAWLILAPREPALRVAAVLVAVTMGSVFLHSEGWWARYAPQAWLAPLAAAVPAVVSELRAIRRLAAALAVLASVNAAFVAGNFVDRQSKYHRDVVASLSEMKASQPPIRVYFGRFMALRQRLVEAQITFETVESPPDSRVETHGLPAVDPRDSFWYR